MADLRLLESVCAVIEAGGVQKAALELGYSQPTLTQRIQQLEAQLGTRLFERAGKRLVPTPAALLVYERGKHLLGQARALEAEVAELSRGDAPVVRFGCIEPVLTARVVPVLAEFLRAVPRARLIAENGTTAIFAQRVLEGAYEFAIAAPLTLDGRLSFTRLFEESVGVLMPSSHRLAAKAYLSFKDLQEVAMIYSDTSCSYRGIFQSTLDRRGVTISPAVEIGSIAARIRAVELGMGVALLPESAARRIPEKTVFRSLERQGGRLVMGVLRRADAAAPGRVLQTLFDLLRARLSARPARSA